MGYKILPFAVVYDAQKSLYSHPEVQSDKVQVWYMICTYKELHRVSYHLRWNDEQ